ncbi:GFA family protein [uncultured Tateyamaria sp.]|uniref:GFA family protein n=1 Tax=uncultured Tateyamaria sp. TaxID=455651 RepID=UPI0026250FF6|nr:GFA family protein [uncultured Tateyamaria sp.]
MLTGSCNCKAITFEVANTIRASACHCGQCRKQSGHHWASGLAHDSDVTITGPVTWFASSRTAKRGFCPTCGCFLFWKMEGEAKISFSLGTIDGATGLRLDRHIFTADKGDYYDIADNVPQRKD